MGQPPACWPALAPLQLRAQLLAPGSELLARTQCQTSEGEVQTKCVSQQSARALPISSVLVPTLLIANWHTDQRWRH